MDHKLTLAYMQEAERRKQHKEFVKGIVGGGYDEFWNNKNRYRVVKGGRGSKKSTTTALWFIHNIMEYPLANAVCVRKVGNTHKDSSFAQLKWAAMKLGVYDKWTFVEKPMEARYNPTGQKILFRGFDDAIKLTSMTVEKGSLCWVWFEEAYEIENEQDFDTFDESIRGIQPEGLFKQITLTFNPWVNSHWTKTRFFDNEYPDTFTLTTTHKCNEYLDEKDHEKIEALATTNPDRYKVVGLGEYGIPGGSYFDEFRTDIHVIDSFVIPEDWKRYRVLDYGLDMLACYWIATDTHNKAYVYKELYQSGLIISDAAKRIIELTNEKIYETIAPPDLWNRRQETGKSAAEIFSDNGVYLTKANNNRIQGWYNLKEWLKPYTDEQEILTASLVITRNCVNLIRTLPQIQSDEKDANDTADQPHELTHAPDAIRYFVAARPTPTRTMKQDSKKKWIQTVNPKKKQGLI